MKVALKKPYLAGYKNKKICDETKTDNLLLSYIKPGDVGSASTYSSQFRCVRDIHQPNFVRKADEFA